MAPALKPLLVKEGAFLGGLSGLVVFADYIGLILGLIAVSLGCVVSYFRLLIVLDERRRAREEAGDK